MIQPIQKYNQENNISDFYFDFITETIFRFGYLSEEELTELNKIQNKGILVSILEKIIVPNQTKETIQSMLNNNIINIDYEVLDAAQFSSYF